MPQVFSRSADTIVRVSLSCLVVVPLIVLGYALAVARSPYTTDQNVVLTQPVPFSHEHHTSQLGLNCLYCHNGVEKSGYAGLPPTETCMTCHSQIWTNAQMLAPVRESFANNRPIHWQRVHRLPDYVYFDHSIHVNKGVGCTTCHGPVGSMPLMYQASSLTMGWCLECHRNPAPNLRPKNAILQIDWTPPKDGGAQGHKLLREYGIEVSHLTDCSVCHR